MPAPYSNDLRERVVRSYLNNEGTYAEIGEKFSVGEATVDRWVARYRRTSSVDPAPMGGDRNSKLDETGHELLRVFVEESPDITRDELVRALAARQIIVSSSAVQRALEKNGLTRKKRRSTPRSARATP